MFSFCIVPELSGFRIKFQVNLLVWISWMFISLVVCAPQEGLYPYKFLITSNLDFMQSHMVPPFSIHQQLPMLAQKSFLMGASAKSSGRSQMSPAIVHQPGSNATLIPDQNWGSIGHQVPGMMMPGADPQKYVQVWLI